MRTAYRVSLAAALAAWLWAGCAAALAQTSQGRDIKLVEGRGELLQYQKDISKVVIAEPKIADAMVVSPREVMVNAKGAGHTTLIVWEGAETPRRYEIEVEKDTTEWESFRKEMMTAAGSDPVTVTGSGETIVLAGSVKTAEQSKRLAGMAQTRAKTVINLLQTPPAAEPREI